MRRRTVAPTLARRHGVTTSNARRGTPRSGTWSQPKVLSLWRARASRCGRRSPRPRWPVWRHSAPVRSTARRSACTPSTGSRRSRSRCSPRSSSVGCARPVPTGSAPGRRRRGRQCGRRGRLGRRQDEGHRLHRRVGDGRGHPVGRRSRGAARHAGGGRRAAEHRACLQALDVLGHRRAGHVGCVRGSGRRARRRLGGRHGRRRRPRSRRRARPWRDRGRRRRRARPRPLGGLGRHGGRGIRGHVLRRSLARGGGRATEGRTTRRSRSTSAASPA